MSDKGTEEFDIHGYKKVLTERLNRVYDLLQKRKIVSNNTEFVKLIDQPVQAASQILNGARHLTHHQLYLLSSKTGLNINWFYTGKGDVFGPSKPSETTEEIPTRLARAIANGDIDPELGVAIIDELTYRAGLNSQLLIENQDLSKKLISIMDRIKEYSKSDD